MYISPFTYAYPVLCPLSPSKLPALTERANNSQVRLCGPGYTCVGGRRLITKSAFDSRHLPATCAPVLLPCTTLGRHAAFCSRALAHSYSSWLSPSRHRLSITARSRTTKPAICTGHTRSNFLLAAAPTLRCIPIEADGPHSRSTCWSGKLCWLQKLPQLS